MTELDRAELLRHLDEQVTFLRSSMEAMQRGVVMEAKRVATAIRVLVHDTGRSTALLTHLGVKAGLGFVDTIDQSDFAEPSDPRVLVVSMGGGLVSMPLGAPDYLPTMRVDGPQIDFEQWWSATGVRSALVSMTRQTIVLGRGAAWPAAGPVPGRCPGAQSGARSCVPDRPRDAPHP